MNRITRSTFGPAGVAILLAGVVGGCAPSGDRVYLMKGSSLTQWKPWKAEELGNTWQAAAAVQIDPAAPDRFVITPGEGIFVSGAAGRTCDLFTVDEFGDCEAHIEFTVPKGSNSGVYFMGAYEIQVFDSYGKSAVTFSDCGGIYARWIDEQNVEGHAPRVNVSRKPGEWQSFDVIFRAPRFDAEGKKRDNARFVKVWHNHTLVHENVPVTGPTRAAMTEREKSLGPLLLQGDHGPVAYRNLWVRPLRK